MDEISTIGEVLELAVARETRAAEFYMAAAVRVKKPASQVLLEALAEEELKHKARLELEIMKEGLVAVTVGKLGGTDLAAYTDELQISPGSGHRNVLGVAVEKERRSFRFYVGLIAIVPESSVREVLLELAEEEARHMVRLEDQCHRLAAGGQ
jgi:rubrerythrin